MIGLNLMLGNIEDLMLFSSKLKAESSEQGSKGRKVLSVKFAYENLEVWNKAVDFAVEVIDTVEEISTARKHYRLLEQIEASSTSVAMNTRPVK